MPSKSTSFDRAADYYDETRGFPPGVAEPAVARIPQAGALNARSRVLEIGVGTGRVALPLARHVGAVFGLDLSLPMLRRLMQKRDGERVLLAQGDAAHLPYPGAAFDAAVAVHVFHLIPNWGAVLRELARVIKPGGVLVHCWSSHESRNPLKVLWDAWDDATDGLPPQHHHAGVPWEQRETFLADSGWQQLGQAQTYPFSEFKSPLQQLDQFERRVSSSWWRLSDAEVARRLAAARRVAAEHFPDLSQPQETARAFYVAAYRPPQTT